MILHISFVVSLTLAIVAATASRNTAEYVLHRNRRDASEKHCPPLKSVNAKLTCTLKDKEVACDNNVEPGTIVNATCKPFFKPTTMEIMCLENGEWDSALYDCTPECGSSNLLDITTATGKEAEPGAFPWHVGLYYRKKKNGAVTWEQKCSGSLITDQFVITVAHCVSDTTETSLRVALGKYYKDWHKTEKREEHRSVSTILFQRDFSKKINAFGLALLRLNEKVEFSDTIMPVCRGFPDGSTYLKNTDLYVAGWGLPKDGDLASGDSTLQYNSVDVVDEDVCRKNCRSVFPTFDKFCTVKNKKSKVTIAQPGGSGAGVTTVYDGLHFILGAVGAKENKYSINTNLTWPYNVIWMENELRKYYPNFKWDKNDLTENTDSDSGCLLPEASSSRKFCSMADGCRNCDTKDPLCFVNPGTKVDRVRVVCEAGYTQRSPHKGGDVAVCMNGQWYPEFPECDKYRYVPGSPWGKVTWQEARDHCVDKGQTLATIKSKGEQENFKETVLKFFTTAGIKPSSVWIGLSDLGHDKTFEWADGSILSKTDFTSWQPGEPSEFRENVYPPMYLEHCVEAVHNCKRVEDCLRWNDNYCSDLNYYFCKETVPSDATFDEIPVGENTHHAQPRYAYVPGNPWSKVTWDEAKENCAAKGSQLAIIRAPDQKKSFNEAVAKQFQDTDSAPSSIWIGLRAANIVREKLFSWVDGSVYNAWRPHVWNNWIAKPSNWNWDCTEAAAGSSLKPWPHATLYQWNDVNCTDTNYYFCSIKL